MTDEPVRALVTRAKAERDEASRRYNEALSALDLARQKFSGWPEAPPLYDEGQITPLNQAWEILPGDPAPSKGGWRGRLASLVWNIVGPHLQRQQAFNAALVDHLNRNAQAHREAHEALAGALPAIREAFDGLAHFELLLLHFLQQGTPLDDARERAVEEAINDLRHVVNVAQRAAQTARRDVERLSTVASGTNPVPQTDPAPPGGSLSDSTASAYVGFEDRFRGSEAEIRVRLADFVPYFAGTADVLDLGCGRGEFLDLLREAGIPARGLDLNTEMVEVCRARGLEAVAGDALTYLSSLPDGSLGGMIAVQVVEHLEPEYLTRMLQAAYDKLRPGAPLVLETINPACWVAFFESYIRDLTHVRPVHPDTLQYLLHASGFSSVEIVYRAPIEEAARLERVPPRAEHVGHDHGDAMTTLVGAFNRNMDRLNARMFTYQDYAAIARR